MKARAFLAAWLLAPIPMAIVNMLTEFIPLRKPVLDDLVGFAVLYGIGLLYGGAAILSVGLLAAKVFERRGITGSGAHILVGAVAAALPCLVVGGPVIALEGLPFGAFGGYVYWRVRYSKRGG
jgi:hypothetical protein